MKVYDGRVKLDKGVLGVQLNKRGEQFSAIACAVRPRVSKSGNPYLERITVLVDKNGKMLKHVRATSAGKVYCGSIPDGTSLETDHDPYYTGEVEIIVPSDQKKKAPYAPPPKHGPEVIGQAEWKKQMDAHKAWLESEKTNDQTAEGDPLSDAVNKVAQDVLRQREKELKEQMEKSLGQVMGTSESEIDQISKFIDEMSAQAGVWDVYAKPRSAQDQQQLVATKVSAKNATEACNTVRGQLSPSQYVISEMTAVPHNKQLADGGPQGKELEELLKKSLDAALKSAAAQSEDDDDDDDDKIILLREEDESLVGAEANERIVSITAPAVRTVVTETSKLMYQKVQNDIQAAVQIAAGLESKLLEIQKQSSKPSVDMNQVRSLIDAEFAKLRPQRIEIVENNKVVRTLDEHTHPIFEEVLRLATKRHPIYLFGPSGSGKTFLAEQIAKALDMDFYALSTTMGTSESQLQGWRLPMGANKFVYVPAEFVRLYEEGGVFLLDEADRSDPNVLSVLNQALANRRLPIPARFEKPVATMHDDFVIMAAGNTAGTGADRLYSSATRLDEAFLDRFRMGTLRMDYDEDLEKALVGDTPVLRRFWQIRRKVAELRLERVVSTRSIIEAHRLELDEKEAVQRLTVTWEPNERTKVGIAA